MVRGVAPVPVPSIDGAASPKKDLTNLDRIKRDVVENSEIRITVVGISGCGKTSFKQSLKAVLTDSECQLEHDVGATAGGHGTRFLTQRVIPFLNNAKLIVTDVQGLDPNSDSVKDLGEDLQFLYIGLFSPHLLYRPQELGQFEREIEANSQHCIILLMSAKDIADLESERNYMCQLCQELRRRQLPFLIVLTKADSLTGTERIMDLVEKVENLSGKHRDFIFSVVNCLRNNENPSPVTVNGIHAVVASVASTAKSFQAGFKITRGMRWRYLIKHNRRRVYYFIRIAAVLAVIVGVLSMIVGSRGGLRAPKIQYTNVA